MRYVCCTCGEGDVWRKDAQARSDPKQDALLSETSEGSSEDTEWAIQAKETEPRSTNQTRFRSNSMSTNAGSDFSLVDPSRSVGNLPGSSSNDSAPRPNTSPWTTRRGYELCPICIEAHGVQHSKVALQVHTGDKLRTKRFGKLRHAFRERIWGSEGWADVGEIRSRISSYRGTD